MNATLYTPGQHATRLDASGFTLATTADQIELAAVALECLPTLVDVLATGAGYLIYTVFDSEAELNRDGMRVVGELTGIGFDPDDDDQALRGPVLVVSA